MKKNIVIIHYNTPILTECLVRSVNRFVDDAHIYIFDNSDKRPFKAVFDNVTTLDNTEGQIINFTKWLEKYPDRTKSGGRINMWGSAKHCYSVEKCMELLGENFILLDSDILLKRDISDLFDEEMIYVGEDEIQARSTVHRILPYVCFINVKMCKEKNVHYFDDNYMHGLYKTPVGDRYDTGGGFYMGASQYPHRDVKWENYAVHYGHASWKKPGLKNPLNPEEWLLHNRKYWSDEMNKKVVYTCITGGYDILKEPKISLGFDYVCFTDNPSIKSDVWEIRPLPKEVEALSPIKQQRFIKINPHLFFKEYELSIWVDGNVSLKGNLNDFIKEHINKDGVSVYVPTHPSRKCAYDEAKAVIAMRKDHADVVEPQMVRYGEEGYPIDNGLLQSNILVRYHNNTDCINLMNTWCDEVIKGSHRDQLSFNYASWKNQDTKVVYLDKNICKSLWFDWNGTHLKNKRVIPTVGVRNRTITPLSKTVKGKELFKKVMNSKRMKSQAIYNRFNGY